MSEERDYDLVVEALRKAICALPRYSFLLDRSGGVRRVPDRSGNWLEFESAHALFDTEAVDNLIALFVSDAAILAARTKGTPS